jgi:addiction module RelB/DinJ family antitoxin
MNTASIFIKTDPHIKEEAQKTAEELGLSLSAIINAYLRELIKTKRVAFSAQPEIPNEHFRHAIERARAHRRHGKASPIFTDDEKLIREDPKKYQHIDTMLEWLHKQGV